MANPPPGPEQPEILLFTSGNAIRAATAIGIPPGWHDVPLIAVGDRTAELARRAGFVQIASAKGDGTAVARYCAEHLNPGSSVLHVAGDGLGHALDRALTEQGHRLSRWDCYRTSAVPRLDMQSRWLMGRRRVSGVLLFSPRSAKAFAKLAIRHGVWPPKRPTRIACISEATAKALLDSTGPNPLLTLCIAQRPDLDSTIDALVSAQRRN